MTIYLDNNATTAIDPDFIPDLASFLSSEPMNASSVHTYGQKAKKLIQSARLEIASYLKVSPGEITFTSGGTESMNSLIFGIVKAQKFDKIITTKLEHACVYEACLELKREGYPVEFIPMNDQETLSVELIQTYAVGKNICIITSSVNSETGALLPLESIANYAQKNKFTLILDGVAHLGKYPLNIHQGITGIGFSSHKIHAPKGSGFYYLKNLTPFKKLFFGGHQESNRRAGTENLFAILGLKLAIQKLKNQEDQIFQKLKELKELFLLTIQKQGCDFELNTKSPTVSNTINIHFPEIDGETLLICLDQDGVLCSMGSACASGALEPSRVLSEMGLSKKRAKASLRFSFSRLNSKEEIIESSMVLNRNLQKLRCLI